MFSVTGLPRIEPPFDAVLDEQRDSAGGESGGSSPSASAEKFVGTATILSFLACRLLDEDLAVGARFNADEELSASLGEPYKSKPFFLLGTRTLSRLVNRFFAATPIPAIPRPDDALTKPDRGA